MQTIKGNYESLDISKFQSPQVQYEKDGFNVDILHLACAKIR